MFVNAVQVSPRFNTNELQTEKKTRAKQDLTAKIEDLESTIKQLMEAIDTLKSEVAEMQVQMKRAGEDREKENKEFQMAVADQRATQKLLTAALNILKGCLLGNSWKPCFLVSCMFL
jgi:predicted RNase H-like nuclease (RuvC/YqgF family)